MYYYIYIIINKLNGKFYIGRRQSVLSPMEDPYMGSGKALKLAINKYGIENFHKEIITTANCLEELVQLEKLYVNKVTIKSPFCYNIVEGGINPIFYGKDHPMWGNGHYNSGERNGMYGKHHTEETKQLFKDLFTGTKHSDETKLKISLAQTGKKHWNYGGNRSKEVKSKISQSLMGQRTGRDNHMVTGLYITPAGKFETSKLAAKANNCSPSAIRNRCKNPNKIIKYHFKLPANWIGKTWAEVGYNFEPFEI
ncbi:MAG: NUMOD3 domain-containing DNA-binding protein [Nitrososphaeraceae archaeon]|nr:NUMOD3 domain-containing DNA-binding protein [Nitrososphaeraceae archaeon]